MKKQGKSKKRSQNKKQYKVFLNILKHFPT